MDKEEIEKLLTLCRSKSERSDLFLSYNAYADWGTKYQTDHSEATRKAYRAAQRDLAARVEQITQRQQAEKVEAPPSSGVLASRAEALRWLKETHGYKISTGKFFQDEKKGLYAVNPDGTVSESEALAYALKAGLKMVRTKRRGMAADELENLAVKAKRAELDKSLAQTEKIRFDLERERGRYLLKDDVRMQLAIKISAFEAGFKNMLRLTASDRILLAGGDPRHAHLVTDYEYREIDRLLNDFADMDEISVTIRKRSDHAPADPPPVLFERA